VTRHIVMWSGGITSWATARHVIGQHGTNNVTLLFADTLIEDDDLYAFNEQASTQLGLPITRVADGRTPWQVFEDKRWLGNTRVAQCSLDLKQRQCRLWLCANADPASTVLYLGIDWTEEHRTRAIRAGYAHTADGCKKIERGKKQIPLCEGLFDKHGKRLPGPGCPNLLPVAWTVDFPLTRAPSRRSSTSGRGSTPHPSNQATSVVSAGKRLRTTAASTATASTTSAMTRSSQHLARGD